MAMTEEEKKAKNREKAKKWNKENKEKRKIIMKKWYIKNKEKQKEYNREWHKSHREEVNKKNRERRRSVVNKGRVFYGYNPCKLAHDYYQKINPESKLFSPFIANSNMSLETYIAMRVFDSSTIMSLMRQLYHGLIKVEEINIMIIEFGFDIESEEFKNLIDCIKNSASESSFVKNYDGMIFTK